MVPFNHIKQKPTDVILFHQSQNLGTVPNCTTDEDDADEVGHCYTSGTLSPMSPLLLGPSGTGRYTSSWIPATLIIFRPSIWVSHLCQGGTTRLWHRSFTYMKLEPSLWLSPGTSHKVQDWDQSKKELLVSLGQRSVDATIKVNPTRRFITLNVVKKGKLWGIDFVTLPGSRI